MARRPRARDRAGEKQGRGTEYSTIDLEALIRFHVYVRDSKNEPVPLSFRAFMKGTGSHLTMLSTVNGIETQAKQLMIARAILDDQNRKTGRYTDSFAEAARLNTRREAGAITQYGHAWADLGRYLDRLMDLMIAAGDNPQALRDLIREQERGLLPLEEMARRRATKTPDKE